MKNENSPQTHNISGAPDDSQVYSDFNLQSVLWFSLGSEEYAIKVDDVQTVLDEYMITPVPNTPKFVLGVINLRGTIIPVIELKKMFQLQQAKTENGMVIVLEISDLDNVRVGVVVDKVKDVLDINFSELQAPPPSLSGLGSEYVSGIHKLPGHVLIVVNIIKIVHIAREMIGKYT